jgi:hypothetical protein
MFIRGCFRELIKNVEVAFILDLSDNPALFQEIIGDLGSNGFPTFVKHDFEVFSL